MNLYTKGKNWKKELICLAICALLGFIAVMISSKNSFLYSFNDSADVQTFVTTARCMLRGDVLYKDVFDVKGPYLYFLYILGLKINSESFLGIFLVESILFVFFIWLCYAIAGLYFENRALKILVAAASAFVSTTLNDFVGGGQCEELMLPVLALAVYIVLAYFRYEYPGQIAGHKVVLLGICTAVVFWVKYTMVGLFAGAIIYVCYLQIKDKKAARIWIYAGEFIVGFFVGSLPMILYFAYHHAFDSLWEVYFYDLLFAYKTPGDRPTHPLSNYFYLYYIAISTLTAYALIYPALDGKKHFGKQEKQSIAWMMLMQGTIISLGRHWWYTPECMNVFAPIGMVGLIYTAWDLKDNLLHLLEKFSAMVHTLLSADFIGKHFYLAFVAAFFLFSDVKIFVIPFVVMIGAVIAGSFLQNLFGEKIQKKRKVIIIKYLALIALAYLCSFYMSTSLYAIQYSDDASIAIKYFWRLTIILSALDDYHCYTQEINGVIGKYLTQWKEEYLSSKTKINILVGALAIFFFALNCYAWSKSSYDIGRPLEDRPQYKIVEYIQNSGIEQPKVIYYQNIDFGYYWLSQSYPLTRFSCGFNMDDLPEIEAIYQKYVEEGEADFILAEDPEKDFGQWGYKLAYTRQDVYVNSLYSRNYILWEKDSLDGSK